MTRLLPVLVLVGCAQAATPTGSGAVTQVEASGKPGAYSFAVTVQSPDVDCSQYASWWEVVGADGGLLYRRILKHSHASEQPFTRSGGPVPVQPDDVVTVRVFVKGDGLGYARAGQRGRVASGFSPITVEPDFASSLATAQPLPTECWY